MNFSIVVSCVSMLGTLTAIYFAVRGGQRTNVSEITQRVEENTRMNMKLDTIYSTVSDINKQLAKLNESVQKHNEKFIEMELKLKGIEQRLDDLESKKD